MNKFSDVCLEYAWHVYSLIKGKANKGTRIQWGQKMIEIEIEEEREREEKEERQDRRRIESEDRETG